MIIKITDPKGIMIVRDMAGRELLTPGTVLRGREVEWVFIREEAMDLMLENNRIEIIDKNNPPFTSRAELKAISDIKEQEDAERKAETAKKQADAATKLAKEAKEIVEKLSPKNKKLDIENKKEK